MSKESIEYLKHILLECDLIEIQIIIGQSSMES